MVNFVFQPTYVSGPSMEPTLETGHILIVEKITQRFGTLKQGDIVSLYVPEQLDEGKKNIIKRIVALEGDRVEIKDGTVYVNKKRLDDSFLTEKYTPAYTQEYSDLVVPKGCVFVLGDNRTNSKDSRMMGPIPVDRVMGKTFVRLFPFNKIGKVR